MARIFTLGAYLRRGDELIITTDASPWAIGGFLIINGIIAEYFHQAISSFDAERMNLPIGTSDA